MSALTSQIWHEFSTQQKKSHGFNSCQISGKVKILYHWLMRAKQRETPFTADQGSSGQGTTATRIFTDGKRPGRMMKTRKKKQDD